MSKNLGSLWIESSNNNKNVIKDQHFPIKRLKEYSFSANPSSFRFLRYRMCGQHPECQLSLSVCWILNLFRFVSNLTASHFSPRKNPKTKSPRIQNKREDATNVQRQIPCMAHTDHMKWWWNWFLRMICVQELCATRRNGKWCAMNQEMCCPSRVK